jgi:hypothetical protein
MTIAVLGWGSLLWNLTKNRENGFHVVGGWRDGPFLPIEFARISQGKDGRRNVLTLVVHPGALPVQVFWAESCEPSLMGAIENLRGREGGKSPIGHVDLKAKVDQPSNGVAEQVREWALSLRPSGVSIDAVVWTDLRSNFESKTHMPLSEDNIVAFLSNLRGADRCEAETYIRATLPRIDTPYRRRIIKDLGWSYDPSIEERQRLLVGEPAPEASP